MPSHALGNTRNVTLRDASDTLRKAVVRTSAQWRAVGVSRGRLLSLVRLGYLVRVRRGAFATRLAAASIANDPCRAHGLQAAAVRASVGRDAVASHQSAALIHGFELLKRPPAKLVTLTCQVHFTWRELFDTPALVIERIRTALTHITPY